MKYAVIKIAGKQYKVAEGQVIDADKITGEPEIKTLLLNDEGKVSIGKPYLEKASVKITLGEVKKGKKIDVFKYKAKSRYRKHIGFRPQYSPVTINAISL